MQKCVHRFFFISTKNTLRSNICPKTGTKIATFVKSVAKEKEKTTIKATQHTYFI